MKFQSPYLVLKSSGNSALLKLVCICWLITKLCCYKLWLASRFFPLVPVHGSLQTVPASFHLLLLAVSLTGMLLFVLFPYKKIAALIFISEVLSCLLDQNRWQPWEYQFICMLGAYIFIKNEQKVRFSWQLILVSLYFFSGLNKCSPYFIYNVWNNLLLKNAAGITAPGQWLLRAGYALPFIEMLAAIALCFASTHKKAAWVLCAMHIFNLLVLGPVALNINYVIWPWNILMPLLLVGLFCKENIQVKEWIHWKPVYNIIILIAWWILPWLQFAGCWDKYLSGVLYSGRSQYLYICSSGGNANTRLSAWRVPVNKNTGCDTAISVYKWSMQEMNSAPYPEERVYRAIAIAFNKMYPASVNHFYLYRGGFNKKITVLVLPK